MAGKLVVQAPGGQRHEFPLTKAVTTIGRGQDADLVLDYEYISRLHAKVERTREGYIIIDCESTNGTEINGRRLTGQQVLASGDDIQFGEIRLTFLDSVAAVATTVFFRPTSGDSPIRCDSSSWQVWIGDKLFEGRLSLQEFELLSLLTSRFGRICTREELGTAIWGRGNYDFNLLHRLILRLKRKLGSEHGTLIVSVPGKGYKITDPVSPAPE